MATLEAVTRAMGVGRGDAAQLARFLACRRCHMWGAHAASSHERKAYAALGAPALAPLLRDFKWVAEAHVPLGERRLSASRADLVVWDAAGSRPLAAIAVDGEGHTRKALHGMAVEKQRALDAEFNAECLRAGVHVLRLHHAAATTWRASLKALLPRLNGGGEGSEAQLWGSRRHAPGAARALSAAADRVEGAAGAALVAVRTRAGGLALRPFRV